MRSALGVAISPSPMQRQSKKSAIGTGFAIAGPPAITMGSFSFLFAEKAVMFASSKMYGIFVKLSSVCSVIPKASKLLTSL